MSQQKEFCSFENLLIEANSGLLDKIKNTCRNHLLSKSSKYSKKKSGIAILLPGKSDKKFNNTYSQILNKSLEQAGVMLQGLFVAGDVSSISDLHKCKNYNFFPLSEGELIGDNQIKFPDGTIISESSYKMTRQYLHVYEIKPSSEWSGFKMTPKPGSRDGKNGGYVGGDSNALSSFMPSEIKSTENVNEIILDSLKYNSKFQSLINTMADKNNVSPNTLSDAFLACINWIKNNKPNLFDVLKCVVPNSPLSLVFIMNLLSDTENVAWASNYTQKYNKKQLVNELCYEDHGYTKQNATNEKSLNKFTKTDIIPHIENTFKKIYNQYTNLKTAVEKCNHWGTNKEEEFCNWWCKMCLWIFIHNNDYDPNNLTGIIKSLNSLNSSIKRQGFMACSPQFVKNEDIDNAIICSYVLFLSCSLCANVNQSKEPYQEEKASIKKPTVKPWSPSLHKII